MQTLQNCQLAYTLQDTCNINWLLSTFFICVVMDSLAWLWVHSCYDVHVIVKALELSMGYTTPISTYLHYLECCNPMRRILSDHCQSVWDVKELPEWQCLNPSTLSWNIWLTPYKNIFCMQRNILCYYERISQQFFTAWVVA